MFKILLVISFSLFICSCDSRSRQNIDLIIGSSKKDISQVRFNTKELKFEKKKLLAKSNSPTSIIQKGAELFYAVNEVERGIVESFKLQEDGSYKLHNWFSPRGAYPNTIDLHPNEKFFAVANYQGRNLPIHPILANGKIERIISRDMQGEYGSDSSKYEPSHITWVGWNRKGDKLYSVNQGMSRVAVNKFIATTGELKPHTIALLMKEKDAPKVMFFHPAIEVGYILSEISSMITVVHIKESGDLKRVQEIKVYKEAQNNKISSPKDAVSTIIVSPNARYLYASNGNSNLIAVFKVNDEDGKLERVASFQSGGVKPRAFYIDNESEFLFVANELSDRINVFKINDESSDQFLSLIDAKLDLVKPAFIDLKLSKKKAD